MHHEQCRAYASQMVFPFSLVKYTIKMTKLLRNNSTVPTAPTAFHTEKGKTINLSQADQSWRVSDLLGTT